MSGIQAEEEEDERGALGEHSAQSIEELNRKRRDAMPYPSSRFFLACSLVSLLAGQLAILMFAPRLVSLVLEPNEKMGLSNTILYIVSLACLTCCVFFPYVARRRMEAEKRVEDDYFYHLASRTDILSDIDCYIDGRFHFRGALVERVSTWRSSRADGDPDVVHLCRMPNHRYVLVSIGGGRRDIDSRELTLLPKEQSHKLFGTPAST